MGYIFHSFLRNTRMEECQHLVTLQLDQKVINRAYHTYKGKTSNWVRESTGLINILTKTKDLTTYTSYIQKGFND